MSAAGQDGVSRDARVHRALSSPVRARILRELRTCGEGLDVHALATLLELHANTVRMHLSVLADAGLVTSQPEARDRPGRPRLVYRASAPDREHEPQDDGRPGGYAFLAEILASHLAATAPDPAEAAEQAGYAWGRYLVDRPAPFQRIEADEAIDRICALLADFGFEPELELVGAPDRADVGPATVDTEQPGTGAAAPAARVLLHRCPFLQVAGRHQQVVCSIHLGLMRGALEQLGGVVDAQDLLPFVEPHLCVSHLALAS